MGDPNYRSFRCATGTRSHRVGAGPSGLNLALALTRRNVQCRLISEAEGPGEESRAMVVQARTLEFYGPYGFTGRVVEQGVVAQTAHVREGGSGGSREVLSISFKEMGPGLSPFPFALAYAPLDLTTRIFELLDQEPFVIVLRIAVDQKTRIFHCHIARLRLSK